MPLTQVQNGMLAGVIPASLGGTGTTAGVTGFKNRLINGDMTISQRNGTSSVTAVNGAYSLDRWIASSSNSSVFSVQQSTTAPAGFNNSILITSLASTAIAAGSFYSIQQIIEGYNIADLGFGTVNAKTVTLSFWVRSSLTGTFSGCIQNGNVDRSYPFTYTISAANTWEQKSVTIPGDTTGTWNTINNAGIYVLFSLGIGSDRQGTANIWNSANDRAVAGETPLVSTIGATFFLTGVQFEVGSQATNFDYLPYSTELMLCQRYYIRYILNTSFPFVGRTLSDNRVQLNLPLRYQMRSTPSLVSSDITAINNMYFGTSRVTPNGTQTYSLSGHESVDVGGILISGGGTYTDGQVALAQIAGSIAYSAEL